MNRLWQTVMAILLVTGAPAWAQVPANSGSPRAAQEVQGSQLLPEAQPPFSPALTGGTAKAAQGDNTAAARPFPVPAEGVAAASGSTAPPAQCAISACAGMYRSFRASDCTYQPYTGGPRQLCER